MQKIAVSLESEGIPIVGEVYFPEGRQPRPALCICHGIPSGLPAESGDGGYPLLAQKYCAAGFVTVIFNFRGTGLSGGNLDLVGWTKDLQVVVGYLCTVERVDKTRLWLMGFSGGAVASAYVASHDPRVSGIILCACPAHFQFLGEGDSLVNHFRRISLIREENFPPSIEEWRRNFDRVAPWQWIDKISPRPLLIVQGDRDKVVEVSHARALYEKAKMPKEMMIVEGGEHKLRLNEKAMNAVLAWLRQRAQVDLEP